MPEITVKTEFKSCPFCSSENIKVEQMEQDNKINVWVCWCGNCGSFGPTHLNWSGAIEMWNLRRSQKALMDALSVTQNSARMSAFGVDVRLMLNPGKAVEYFNSMFPEVVKALALMKGDQS